ncbi:MAG TPA: hypothetical protein VGG96_05285 [Steroidobacteraceae bacterium]
MMKLTTRQLAGFCALAVLMAVSRSGHIGSAWSPPDASWPVLYLAGFYFGRQWRWALPTLLCTAIVVDFIVIKDFGVSSYCVTAAYAFILPAYSLLWLGGAWLRRQYHHQILDLVRCAASLGVAASLCFLVTNASFYWLGSRVPDPTFTGWWASCARWYPDFLGVSFTYIAIGAVLQAAFARPARAAVTVTAAK